MRAKMYGRPTAGGYRGALDRKKIVDSFSLRTCIFLPIFGSEGLEIVVLYGKVKNSQMELEKRNPFHNLFFFDQTQFEHVLRSTGSNTHHADEIN